MLEYIPYVILGTLLHYLKHYAQAKKVNANFKFIGYWTENLDTTITYLTTVITTYIAVNAAGDINMSSAFLIGIGSNSVAGYVGKRDKVIKDV